MFKQTKTKQHKRLLSPPGSPPGQSVRLARQFSGLPTLLTILSKMTSVLLIRKRSTGKKISNYNKDLITNYIIISILYNTK